MGRHARSRYAPDTLPRPAHWSAEAACVGANPDLFHPEGDPVTVLRATAVAKTYCARCGVREQCLTDAMERGEPHGVFGGLDESQRRAITRRERERERAARRREKRRREREQEREEAADASEGKAAAPAA